MLLRLSERVPIYSLKVDIIFPSKEATKGQKMHVIIPTLRWIKLAKFLVDISFNDLKLDIFGRYRDDTFIPWLHGIDNLLIFKKALDEHIGSVYPNIYFTMIRKSSF